MHKLIAKRLTMLRFAVLVMLALPGYTLLSTHTYAHNEPDTENNDEHDDHDAEQPLHISQHMLTLNQISTETATAVTLVQKIHLYGVIAAIPEQQTVVKAPYAAVVDNVTVKQGDNVSKGQVLANLTNLTSLKSYQLLAPLSGVITQRHINNGELVRDETLFGIANYNQVYVEMSAFPADIAKLQLDMPVSVFSLHQSSVAHGTIRYISPQMTEGHIARVRALIANDDGYWRPGMHIKADIHTAEVTVPVAVRKSALQRVDEQPAVFVRHGDSFTLHKLTLGREDDDYIEVLKGLDSGSEYASANSFILKADLLKSGASHQH